MTDVWTAVREDRVIAVVRADRVADPAGVADALADGGIRCVEFTATIPDFAAVIKAAVDGARRAIVGAGTILDGEQVRGAVQAGARFIVSPALRPALVEGWDGGPVFMGATTPTEAVMAMEAGAVAVKLFPASIGGPAYLRALRGPLPDIPFIPSGGVDASTAPAYLAAGAVAVYAGSSIAPADAVEAGELTRITELAASFTDGLIDV